MSQPSTALNPFMLLVNPEVILAAIEKSEHLSQLNRHLCRPLDRLTPGTGNAAEEGDSADDVQSADSSDVSN